MRLWDVAGEPQGELHGRDAGQLDRAEFSPDGTRIVSTSSVSRGGCITIWNLRGHPLAVMRTKGRITTIAFSPDGKRITTAGANGSVRVWSLDGRVLIAMRAGAGGFEVVQYSADGKRLLTVSKDHTVRIFDAATGRMLSVLKPEEKKK